MYAIRSRYHYERQVRIMRIRVPSQLARYYGNFPFDMEDIWPSGPVNQGLDVYEENDKIVVKAAVPGIPAEKVEITFEDGVLRIRASMQETEEEKEKKSVVYRMERSTSFDYATTFPRPVDTAQIDARVEDGVVVITAPIAEAAKPKKIEVKK